MSQHAARYATKSWNTAGRKFFTAVPAEWLQKRFFKRPTLRPPIRNLTARFGAKHATLSFMEGDTRSRNTLSNWPLIPKSYILLSIFVSTIYWAWALG